MQAMLRSMCRGHARRGAARFIPVLGLLLVGLTAASARAQSTDDIVDEIDRERYFGYMWDDLYTHPGDDRGFGPQHDLARDNIFDWFTSLGLDTELDPFWFQGQTEYNVVGVKLGSVHPDRQYIIGAHFDSANTPGADDNASGTAGVMEVARVLAGHEFEATIIFIAFDREEHGFYGSEAYAVEHRGDDIRSMISMDMIAYDAGANRVDLYGRTGSNALKQSLAQAIRDYGDGLGVEVNGRRDVSDHAPFEWEGFQAALLVEDGSNPYRHTQDDHVEMPDYLDFDFATNVCRSVCGWLVEQAVLVTVDCPGDVDRSGTVDLDDLLAVLSAWGVCGDCSEDLDGNGFVDFGDLLVVLDGWGACP